MVRWGTWATAIVLGVITAIVRFLSVVGFPNDHYLHLAGAQQILFGEWPTRDFVDPGMPLMYAASAGAQLLIGRSLLAEAVLVSVAFGLATALTVFAARRLSGSLAIAVPAALAQLLIFPRSYGYPKLLFYAAAPLVAWWYAARPSVARLAALSALVAIAFLFRHDHGVFLGVAAFVAVALTHAALGPWRALARAGLMVAFTVLWLVPYGLYVMRYGGLVDYVRVGAAYSRAEADRTRMDMPRLVLGDGLTEACGKEGGGVAFARCAARHNADAWMFYGFYALPLAALAVVGVAAGRRRDWDTAALVAPVAVLALLVDWSFLRDPLESRLPDVIVPAVLLFAWLAGRAVRVAPFVARLVPVAGLALLATISAEAIAVVGDTYEQLDRTGLAEHPGRAAEFVRAKWAEFGDPYSREQMPDGRVEPLVPFFRYLQRCTTPDQRLLVTGNAPELYVFARRPFAGGLISWFPGYYAAADSALAQSRLDAQRVAFVLVLTDWYGEWVRAFPPVAAWVSSRFVPMTDIRVNDERSVHVLVHRDFLGADPDASTGWPCAH